MFILVSSHAYILYMVATKPFQTPLINGYMLANETFYSALIILIFIFSDATPQIYIKVVAGKLLLFTNEFRYLLMRRNLFACPCQHRLHYFQLVLGQAKA